MKQRFLRCSHCGNIVAMVEDKGVPVMCCGQKMEEIVPNTTEAAEEKHIPVVTKNGDKVSVVVGSVEHPMTEDHLINWVVLETTGGSQMKVLKPGDAPKAEFALAGGDAVLGVYAYCNLHGLWKA